MYLQWFTLAVVILALFIGFSPRAKFANHLTGHPAFAIPNLIPEDINADLGRMIRVLSEFPSNLDQAAAANSVPANEQIGEGIEISENGSCSHDYLFPNFNKSLCILPQRVDVGRHYVTTGGLDGKKELYEDLIGRVSSFGQYNFVDDIENLPDSVKKLFSGEKFQAAVKRVCPATKQWVDAFQYNFIVQVPGQTVAVHLDVPAFWGATRFEFPQWLLVAMKFSGLFEQHFIDQIQVVGYLHEWQNDANDEAWGGEFLYYVNATSVQTVQPLPRSGTILDGTKVLHAAKVYRPNVKAPVLNKDKRCLLKYVGAERWEIRCDGELVQEYSTIDLRLSIVYRARCFRDKAEQRKFYAQSSSDRMKLDDILDIFKRDLISRHIATQTHLGRISMLHFALLIIDTYIKYPLPPLELAWVPINYCAIPRVLKWSQPFFRLIC